MPITFAAAILLVAVLVLPHEARGDWPWSGLTSDPPPVGTPEWWDKNQKKAEFEPGKGYKVPGVEGYFDQNGRPMSGPVAAEQISRAAAPRVQEGLVPGLDPGAGIEKFKEAVGLGPNEQRAREAYARGTELFQAGDYAAAADAFGEAVRRAAFSPLEQDALFMLAESHFFNDRYIKARDAYNELVKKHPNTRYLDTLIERQWSIARYWEQYEEYHPDWAPTVNVFDKTRPMLDTLGHAIKTYDSIRLNDPTGPRADDAIMATANIYFRRGRYDDADYHYTLLRREYPRSELQFEAHLLGLQAKLRMYQGADYDGTPLEEGKALVRQIRRQFAGRLGEEDRERLRVVEGQLQYQLAMQDFTMAEHYDNTKHYGAARMYYARVLEQYPDTELAEQSRERLAQISGEPAEPPKFLAGVVDLFPQSKEKARMAKIPEIRDGRTRLARTPPQESGTNGVQPAAATTSR